MKIIYRLLFLTLILMLFLSPIYVLGTSIDQLYKDVPEGAWYSEVLRIASEQKLIYGDNGMFRPNEPLTVEQAVTLGLRLMGIEPEAKPGDENWATKYIREGLKNGIVVEAEIGDNSSRPATRTEIANILMRASEKANLVSYPDELSTYSYLIPDYNDIKGNKDYVLKAYVTGIISGKTGGYFKPMDIATRAESAAIVVRLKNKEYRVNVDLTPKNEIGFADNGLPLGYWDTSELKNNITFLDYVKDKELANIYIKRFLALNDFLREDLSILNPPTGFVVKPSIAFSRYNDDESPLFGKLRWWFYQYYIPTGKDEPVQNSHFQYKIGFEVNDISCLKMDNRLILLGSPSEKAEEIFTQPIVINEWDGYKEYDVGKGVQLIFLTKREQQPFIPVSREEYLEARIDDLNEKWNETKEDLDVASYEQYRNIFDDWINPFKAELASLSEEEKNSQAWIGMSAETNSWLVPAEYKDAQPLVKLNDNFFDKNRPTSEWQSLVIYRSFADERFLQDDILASYPDKIYEEIDFSKLLDEFVD